MLSEYSDQGCDVLPEEQVIKTSILGDL